jgi:hypothetical protein
MDARYWSATHTPILDAQGDVEFILQHTVDETERANAVEARNRNLAEESKQLKALLEEARVLSLCLMARAICSAWPIAPIAIL